MRLELSERGITSGCAVNHPVRHANALRDCVHFRRSARKDAQVVKQGPGDNLFGGYPRPLRQPPMRIFRQSIHSPPWTRFELGGVKPTVRAVEPACPRGIASLS